MITTFYGNFLHGKLVNIQPLKPIRELFIVFVAEFCFSVIAINRHFEIFIHIINIAGIKHDLSNFIKEIFSFFKKFSETFDGR